VIIEVKGNVSNGVMDEWFRIIGVRDNIKS
jgi:hypothetical protein